MRERRKAPRYAFGLTGMLHRPGERVGTKVVVRTISTQGCAIEGARGYDVGKKCELYIDWHDLHVGVEAEVVSEEADGGIGLKFRSVDPDMQARLGDLCSALRARAMSVGLSKPPETAGPLAESATAPASATAAPSPAPSPIPKPAPKRERRRVPRYVSELHARLLDPDSGTTSKAALITLSIRGGCLEGRELPAPGLTCELATEWQGQPLRLTGEIVWNIQGKHVGLKFSPLDDTTEQLLRQVCSSLRLQPMAPIPPEPA